MRVENSTKSRTRQQHKTNIKDNKQRIKQKQQDRQLNSEVSVNINRTKKRKIYIYIYIYKYIQRWGGPKEKKVFSTVVGLRPYSSSVSNLSRDFGPLHEKSQTLR